MTKLQYGGFSRYRELSDTLRKLLPFFRNGNQSLLGVLQERKVKQARKAVLLPSVI